MKHDPSPQLLPRVVGLPGAVLLGLGSILGTGVFVSLGIATGMASSGVITALIAAAALATFNGLSSAQLAAAYPVAGGTYEYAYRTIGPRTGYAAGWLFLAAKCASAATAAKGFAGYLLSLGSGFSHQWADALAVLCIAVVTMLTASGIKRSNTANVVMVSLTLVGLGAFCWLGFTSSTASEAESIGDAGGSLMGILQATAILFVAYTGYGRVATLGEEVIDPRRTIPQAIVMTLIISAGVYVAVAAAALHGVGAARFAAAATEKGASLAILARELGNVPIALLVTIASLTAMFGVQLNLSLGLSRVVLAMARRGDLPKPLAHLDSSGTAPRAAVYLVGVAVALLVVMFDIKLSWSFSAFTVLLYYGLTNLAALRMPSELRRLPTVVPALGLIACSFLAFWVEPKAIAAGLIIFAAGFLLRFLIRKP